MSLLDITSRWVVYAFEIYDDELEATLLSMSDSPNPLKKSLP
jgi:hypothetical protein